nr:hypothetical protein [Burkholderia sp. TSV86]
MKFTAVAGQEVGQFCVDGVAGPVDEATPVIFEVLPDDLDHVQFGAVGRQKEQECFVFSEPAVSSFLADAVMNCRVVEHDDSGSAVVLPNQHIEELLDIGAFDAVCMRGANQTVLPVGAEHGASAVAVWFDTMAEPVRIFVGEAVEQHVICISRDLI